MPHAPLKPCLEPGCPALSANPRCDKHTPQTDPRGTSTERGYGAAWSRVRLRCLVRDDWRCTACGWEPDVVRLAREHNVKPPHVGAVIEELRRRKLAGYQHLHGDHIETIANAPHRRLDSDNVQTLCNRCHAAKHAGTLQDASTARTRT
jgi:5-methylcytosine-specific restriction endonuclease McrA